MDFIERIGEGYLERKAAAVPYQLEGLAKKQYKKAAGSAAAPPSPSAPSTREKDKEIAKLRQELAATKQHRGGASIRSKDEISDASDLDGLSDTQETGPDALVRVPEAACRRDSVGNGSSEDRAGNRRASLPGITRTRDGRLAQVSSSKKSPRERPTPASMGRDDARPLVVAASPPTSSRTSAGGQSARRKPRDVAPHVSQGGAKSRVPSSAASSGLRGEWVDSALSTLSTGPPARARANKSRLQASTHRDNGFADDAYYVVEVLED